MKLASVLVSICLCFAFTGCKKHKPAEDPPDDSERSHTKPNEMFWQLQDDSELTVSITPWPPAGGHAQLTARASLGDWSETENFTTDLRYRIGATGPFQSMRKSGPDQDGNLKFTADMTMLSGPANVQLQVQNSKGESTTLGDWTVKVP
jgi:hypothetical protein